MNTCILKGNLTRDPESRQTQSSTVCNTGIAVNRRWKDRDGNAQEEVMFIDLEAWGKTAEAMLQYLNKGSPVLVQGRLKLNQWEKDGQKHSRHVIQVDHVEFLGGGTANSEKPKQSDAPLYQRGGKAKPPQIDHDDIPF